MDVTDKFVNPCLIMCEYHNQFIVLYAQKSYTMPKVNSKWNLVTPNNFFLVYQDEYFGLILNFTLESLKLAN